MCLYSKTDVPLIAEEDIPIEKLYVELLYDHKEFKKGDIMTTFTGKKIDNLIGIHKAEGEEDISRNEMLESFYRINGGFIHSVKSEWGILKNPGTFHALFDMSVSKQFKPIVVKGIIPKGTEFFIGERHDYASKVIEITSIKNEVTTQKRRSFTSSRVL